MVPELSSATSVGAGNSMIPHPVTITPGWQDPIGRLPYHVIPISGHDTPNTTLCQKVKKNDYHKDCDI